MSRTTRAALVTAALSTALTAGVVVSCSKSAGTSKDTPKPASGGEAEVIAPPPGGSGPGGAKGGATEGAVPAGNDAAFKLKPEEGQLSIEVPADAKAGAETTARVVVTTSPKFKINFEYPTKLSLEPNPAVTIPKAELKAGGANQSKGDAEKFEEKQLAFAVKLTPTAAGSHTLTGSFKFAVCDKDQCLPKREAIAIQVAAK